MKKRFLSLTISLFMVIGLSLPALADEPKPYSSVSAAFLSQYVWRGYELSKDSLVIQPSITVGYAGFEANLWGNLDTDDKYTGAEKTKWNETDLTLFYTYDLGPAKLSGGSTVRLRATAESQGTVFQDRRELPAFPHPVDLSGDRQLSGLVPEPGDRSFLQPDQGNHPGPGGRDRLPDFRYRQNR